MSVFLWSDVDRAVNDCLSELTRLIEDRGYDLDILTATLNEQGFGDLADALIQWQHA